MLRLETLRLETLGLGLGLMRMVTLAAGRTEVGKETPRIFEGSLGTGRTPPIAFDPRMDVTGGSSALVRDSTSGTLDE